MDIEQVIKQLRDREYMSGVDRDRARVKSTGEVFTPTKLVNEILEKLPPEEFKKPERTFLDPSCGDGQFLSEVVIRKIQGGSTYEQALDTTFGVDLMRDNCIACIRRLYGVGGEPEIKILEGDDIPREWRSVGLEAVFEVNGKICNIVCADGLTYDYSFGQPIVEEISNEFGLSITFG